MPEPHSRCAAAAALGGGSRRASAQREQPPTSPVARVTLRCQISLLAARWQQAHVVALLAHPLQPLDYFARAHDQAADELKVHLMPLSGPV